MAIVSQKKKIILLSLILALSVLIFVSAFLLGCYGAFEAHQWSQISRGNGLFARMVAASFFAFLCSAIQFGIAVYTLKVILNRTPKSEDLLVPTA